MPKSIRLYNLVSSVLLSLVAGISVWQGSTAVIPLALAEKTGACCIINNINDRELTGSCKENMTETACESYNAVGKVTKSRFVGDGWIETATCANSCKYACCNTLTGECRNVPDEQWNTGYMYDYCGKETGDEFHQGEFKKDTLWTEAVVGENMPFDGKLGKEANARGAFVCEQEKIKGVCCNGDTQYPFCSAEEIPKIDKAKVCDGNTGNFKEGKECAGAECTTAECESAGCPVASTVVCCSATEQCNTRAGSECLEGESLIMNDECSGTDDPRCKKQLCCDSDGTGECTNKISGVCLEGTGIPIKDEKCGDDGRNFRCKKQLCCNSNGTGVCTNEISHKCELDGGTPISGVKCTGGNNALCKKQLCCDAEGTGACTNEIPSKCELSGVPISGEECTGNSNALCEMKACCTNDICSNVISSECTGGDGTPVEGDACAGETDPRCQAQACCGTPDAQGVSACTDVTPSDCSNGTLLEDDENEDGAPDLCKGAQDPRCQKVGCCANDGLGTCNDVRSDKCDTPLEGNALCENAGNPDPRCKKQACCLPGEEEICNDKTPTECEDAGGKPSGGGTIGVVGDSQCADIDVNVVCKKQACCYVKKNAVACEDVGPGECEKKSPPGIPVGGLLEGFPYTCGDFVDGVEDQGFVDKWCTKQYDGGACCSSDGKCSIAFNGECSEGAVHYGNDSCSGKDGKKPFQCPQPTGCCSSISGFCSDILENTCKLQGDIPALDSDDNAVLCAKSVNCPQQACCNWMDQCINAPVGKCGEYPMNGIPQYINGEPVLCEAIGRDCNRPPAVCNNIDGEKCCNWEDDEKPKSDGYVDCDDAECPTPGTQCPRLSSQCEDKSNVTGTAADDSPIVPTADIAGCNYFIPDYVLALHADDYHEDARKYCSKLLIEGIGTSVTPPVNITLGDADDTYEVELRKFIPCSPNVWERFEDEDLECDLDQGCGTPPSWPDPKHCTDPGCAVPVVKTQPVVQFGKPWNLPAHSDVVSVEGGIELHLWGPCVKKRPCYRCGDKAALPEEPDEAKKEPAARDIIKTP